MSAGQQIPDAVESMAEYSDEPGADAGALPVWFLSKMSRRHVTVALSGDGGDELFGGYLTYHADRLARPLRHVPALIRRTAWSAASRLIPGLTAENRTGIQAEENAGGVASIAG